MMYLVVALAGLLGSATAKECECTGSNEGIPEDSPHSLDKEFGKFCRRWDEKYGVCLKATSPLWCEDKWCYVEEGCTVGGEVTAKPSTYKDSGLFFSYEVCGNANRFDEPGFRYNWEKCPKREYPVEVYFAIDESGSIDAQEWEEVQKFMHTLIDKGMVHEDDKVGITTWARKSTKRYGLDESLKSIVDDLANIGDNNMEKSTGDTYTDVGILDALDFMENDPGLTDAKRLLIIVTDGLPDPDHGPCDDGKVDEVKSRIEELGVQVGILAIEDKARKKDLPFEKRLGCLVEEDKVAEQMVIMSNFYSFYEYRDPTEGDICVNAELFSASFTPTSAPVMPTPAPTSMPTKEVCVPQPDEDDSHDDDPVPNKMCAKKKRNKCSKMDECTWDADKNVCLGVGGGAASCMGIRHHSTCDDLKNCSWDKQRRVCEGKGGEDWMDTNGPHYWETCARNFCEKHTWEGGIAQCHYDAAENGCGCMGITDLDECRADNDCQVNKMCKCEDKVPCETLDFDQCKADDRCDVCDGGCATKCSLAPGVTLEDNIQLILDHHDCTCKLHTVYKCAKQCPKQ